MTATVVVEVEEESSMEVLEARASKEKDMRDQVVRTGNEPVHEAVEERRGAEPVLMDVEIRLCEQGMNLFMRL